MNKKHNHCSVENCSSKHFAKSFCIKHYSQMRAWGHIVSDEERLERYQARPRGVHPAKEQKVHWSDDHIAAIKLANTGRRAWNKIGEGVTSKNKLERAEFRKTIQALVFQRDNFTCQVCYQYGGYLQVDHIKKWSDYPELRFDIDNCRTLCMACHYYVTFKRKIPKGVIWGHNLSRRIA